LQLAMGLGNPGERYIHTRHNLGFRVVDLLGERLRISLKPVDGLYAIGLGFFDDAQIALAKPLTFMNGSGQAAAVLFERCHLELGDLLVICDDTNLPLGKIRLRRGGSDGGHRGLSSIIDHLASESFPRLRLGIGPPPENEDLINFVLTDFAAEDEKAVAEMVEGAAEAAICFFSDGVQEAMNRFNG
jgi:PTH1 family peptidyl-tRNA hydrolase